MKCPAALSTRRRGRHGYEKGTTGGNRLDFSQVEHLGKIAANPALPNNFTDLFLATGGRKTATQQLDHNEEIEIVLVSMEELMHLLKRQEIKQSLHANCIF